MTPGVQPITVAPLTGEHAAAACSLTMAVGWTHRHEDWLLALSAGHGLGAFDATGALRGALTWFSYGGHYASVGMVVVDPSLQRGGIGRALMARVQADAGERTLMLIATAAGQPLYESLGYRTTGRNAAHIGIATAAGTASDVTLAKGGDLEALTAMDGRALGYPRPALMAALAAVGETAVLRTAGGIVAFAICRAFGKGYVVGPVIAHHEDQARLLIAYWLARYAGRSVRVDVPDGHAALAAWLAGQGLPRGGAVAIMTRGDAPLPAGPERRYTLASQAMG